MRLSILITGVVLLVVANLLAFYGIVGRITNEGFANYFLENAGGAGKDYKPMGPFDDVKLTPENGVSAWRNTAPNEKLNGFYPPFQLGPDNLFMFKDNQCKPECCGASFACDSGGCVCTSAAQRDFLNKRGGNRTVEDGF